MFQKHYKQLQMLNRRNKQTHYNNKKKCLIYPQICLLETVFLTYLTAIFEIKVQLY